MRLELIRKRGPKGGEPTIIFTEEDFADVERLAATSTIGEIADYFGISERCFREIRHRQPEVDTYYKRAKAKAHAEVGGTIKKMATEGNVPLLIFYAKTRMGWRETDKSIDLNVSTDNPKINIVFSDDKKED